MNNTSNWSKNTDTYIWVFNVGRGLSVFVRTPNNHGILYDLGASDEFSPLEFIQENILPHLTKYESANANHQLAQVVVSHPHADHISEVEKLENVSMGLLTCPHDKNEDEGFDFDTIEDHENLKKYRELFKERKLPLQTIQYKSRYTTVVQAEYGIYYIRPPQVKKIHAHSDYKYANGCSLILYYKYGPNSLLISGDMTPECFAHLLEEKEGSEKRYSIFSYEYSLTNWHSKTSNQPSLKYQLNEYGLTVLVAPHHGLQSCYSEELYKAIKGGKPKLVVISEKRHLSENDGTVDDRYQSEEGATGMDVTAEGETKKKRYSVTTRNGHHFLIKFGSDKIVKVFGDSDPLNLLEK